MKTIELKGRAAVVTGAAGGIGRASAQALAEAGARVVVADINLAGVEETAAMIGDQALPVQTDVADPAQCEALIQGSVEAYGAIDILFNNAGIAGATAYTANQSVEDWQRVIDINLSGVFYCTRFALPHMCQEGRGVIINTSSVDGLNGMATLGPYTAAKHGVIGLTRTVAVEYGRENIRCVAICPGFVATPMTQHGLTDEMVAILAQAIPNPGGTPAQPEAVAEMVVWLASDNAGYVNGSTHVVDAGLTAGYSLPEPGG
jgi:NAD(P)-dependent dehydrogenase (short-subunit alcohol dehydrogenase family)